MYDVVIIGAGVTGAAVARELSRYQVKVCVVEKEEDVCCGTSKANSAIVHAGYDAKTGSLKATLNVRGNEKMERLAKELDIPFRRTGSLVICRSKEEVPELVTLYERGMANGVRGLSILSQEEVRAMEPAVSKEVYAALYAPTSGIICPFELNIALAENAYENGVEFCFNMAVRGIQKTEYGFLLQTDRGGLQTKCVVNAAGIHADTMHNMVSEKKLHIIPRRGEYCLLDKSAGSLVGKTIFELPGKYGKGILVSPTIHGNLLIGPTAQDTQDREDTATTKEGITLILERAGSHVENLPVKQIITSFAGLRAHEDGGEFVIGEPADAPGFIDCAGIESPGLTACPAIGEMAAGIIKERLKLSEKRNFISERKGILKPGSLSREERNRLIREKPAYGTIVCRCEGITEGEIIDAIRRPLGAKSIDGIKRRTRAGMGRCQSGFCLPRLMEILARELQISMSDVTKSGGHSRLITGTGK